MEFTWEAEDPKLGMTADEMIRGLGKAKMIMGASTRMTLRVKIGWNGQLRSVTAKPFKEDVTQIKDTTFTTSDAPLA